MQQNWETYGGNHNNLVCEAKEVTLQALTAVTATECTEGQGFNVTLNAVVKFNTARADFGWYIATDGQDPMNGQKCAISPLIENGVSSYSLTKGRIVWDQDHFGNLYDQCGNIEDVTGGGTTVTVSNFAYNVPVKCTKSALSGTGLSVPVCMSWKQPGGDDECKVEGLYPGSPAKCQCMEGVVSNIQVRAAVATAAPVPPPTNAPVPPPTKAPTLAPTSAPVAPEVPPEAVDDFATTNEETPVTINVKSNDIDHDGNGLFVSIVSNAQHGATVVHNDGKITYTPEDDFHGEETFTYMICEPEPTRRRQLASRKLSSTLSTKCTNDDGYEIELIEVVSSGSDYVYKYKVGKGTGQHGLSHWDIFMPKSCGVPAQGSCQLNNQLAYSEPVCVNPGGTDVFKCDTNGWNKGTSSDIMTMRIPKANVVSQFGGNVTALSKSGNQGDGTAMGPCPVCMLMGPDCDGSSGSNPNTSGTTSSTGTGTGSGTTSNTGTSSTSSTGSGTTSGTTSSTTSSTSSGTTSGTGSGATSSTGSEEAEPVSLYFLLALVLFLGYSLLNLLFLLHRLCHLVLVMMRR